MNNLKVCLVQADLVWESPAENRSRIENLLAREAGQHDLVVLPEMFTTGFTMQPEGLAEPTDGPTLAWMQALSQRLDAVLMGSIIVREGEAYYNRMLVVDPQGMQLTYDKRHLFRMAGEHESYAAGQNRPIFTLKGWKICPQICYDLRFPVYARNQFDAQGQATYDLIVYVANWPEPRISHWSALLKARAIENQAFAIGVNRVGVDGKDIRYTGDSAAIDHLGRELVSGRGEELLLRTELDGAELARYRSKFPVWMDADGFQLDGD